MSEWKTGAKVEIYLESTNQWKVGIIKEIKKDEKRGDIMTVQIGDTQQNHKVRARKIRSFYGMVYFSSVDSTIIY